MHIHIRVYMATKTLTIMEDAYNMLKASKRENESFSEVIRRICKDKKKDLRKHFGVMSNETAEDIYYAIRKSRENTQDREIMEP